MSFSTKAGGHNHGQHQLAEALATNRGAQDKFSNNLKIVSEAIMLSKHAMAI